MMEPTWHYHIFMFGRDPKCRGGEEENSLLGKELVE